MPLLDARRTGEGQGDSGNDVLCRQIQYWVQGRREYPVTTPDRHFASGPLSVIFTHSTETVQEVRSEAHLNSLFLRRLSQKLGFPPPLHIGLQPPHLHLDPLNSLQVPLNSLTRPTTAHGSGSVLGPLLLSQAGPLRDQRGAERAAGEGTPPPGGLNYANDGRRP